jgi:hypothetical protein
MRMSVTPKAIQDLLDELEASKQSRLRAWNAVQRIRALLSDLGKTEIAPAAQKTFDAEGEILEHALTKSLRIGARRSKVCVHRFAAFGTLRSRRVQKRLSSRSLGFVESVGSLDRAEDLIQN